MKYLPSFILGVFVTLALAIGVLANFAPQIAKTAAVQTLAVQQAMPAPELGVLEFEYQREPEDYFTQWRGVQFTNDATGLFAELDEDEAVIFLKADAGNDASAIHEAGHWYDYTQGNISLTPEFLAAIDAYLVEPNPEWPELQEQIRNDYLLPEEIFADLYRLMMVSPDRIPDVFRVFFHDTFYARVNPEWRVGE